MQHPETFTTLHTLLQRYEEQGWLTPCPGTERSRFLAFAANDVVPLTRRLTTLLQQAGISAQDVVELDQENPWCGLFLDEAWTQGLWVQAQDGSSMLLTIRLGGTPPTEEQQILPYRYCTQAGFASLLERTIERLIIRPPM